MRKLFLAVVTLLFCAAHAHAQLPIHFSANAGIAKPVSNDADAWNSGYHFGVGAKIALIPLQFDAALDHMGAKGATGDLNVGSVTADLNVPVTPGLLPAGLYLLAGGGFYHALSATNAGVNAGVGVRLGIPGISLFAEAKGNGVFRTGNKLTYGTLGAGLRF